MYILKENPPLDAYFAVSLIWPNKSSEDSTQNFCLCTKCANSAAAAARFTEHCTPISVPQGKEYLCGRLGCNAIIPPDSLSLKQRDNYNVKHYRLICKKCQEDGFTPKAYKPIECQNCHRSLASSKYHPAEVKGIARQKKAFCISCKIKK